VEIIDAQFHAGADQTAFSQHSDLPPAAHVGAVDCQSGIRRGFERLCRCAGCLADCGGNRTTGIRVVQEAIASRFGQIALFGCTFAFFLHLCGGIRHLVWDAGYGFALRSIYVSGWVVVAASVALTVAAWVASLFVAG